jgi:hypothetical protein
MKRFKTQQAYFALIMLVVSVLLITGCGSDEAALLKAQHDSVLPGTDTCTEAGPKVISSIPTNNTENVTISTTITAVFSEAMDPTTIAYTNQNDPQVLTFTLRDNAHPLVNIEGTVAMSSADTVATFKPTADLSGDSWYTATVTTYAKRLSDNSELGCSYQWEFKTIAP